VGGGVSPPPLVDVLEDDPLLQQTTQVANPHTTTTNSTTAIGLRLIILRTVHIRQSVHVTQESCNPQAASMAG
jgi:hypothetical protein